ncbi:BTB/POZ domain containing protein [Nitzschia inconspicua]|uniref:BTB/POZ domain containing protein n=1 Tax=Nitzschia inconspicua TaxID=303405 RepID=A0A9K3Q3X4_9STRA|nr:BTB/POZ domain containing protein [Nitzschia inconspicua]KAG7344695.1 BTB/POZ domain containing protein [Nitzschia inconspicua]KAG7370407.1 BTB/POZ domain containing protein [Nitzschia inconspicua]
MSENNNNNSNSSTTRRTQEGNKNDPNNTNETDDTEIPLSSALESLVFDEIFADVQFQCIDDTSVPACRPLLASRSPVFRALLYGNWKESNKDVPMVQVGYTSSVMKCIVEYCIRGDEVVDIYQRCCSFCSNNDSHNDTASTILDLMDAANYYQLPKLKKSLEVRVKKDISTSPKQLTVAIWEEVQTRTDGGNNNTNNGLLEELKVSAWDAIVKHPQKTILKYPQDVSFETWSLLVRQPFLPVSELELFHGIQDWYSRSPDDRLAAAGDLLEEYVDLSRIHPKILQSEVEGSELVSMQHLVNVYRSQSLFLVESATFDENLKRTQRLWKGCNSTVATSKQDRCDLICLDMEPPICHGKWSWSLEMKEGCDGLLSVGVAAPRPGCTIESSPMLWLHSCNGRRSFHSGSSSVVDYGYFGLEYDEDSVVTLKLDLTAEGTLSACVDRCRERILFTDMKSDFENAFGSEGSLEFTPCLFMASPANVMFLGFEDIPNDERVFDTKRQQ